MEVLKKAGKQTLELRQTSIGKRLVITDGWRTNWIVIYDDGSWARGCGLVSNKSIERFLNKNGKKLLCKQK